MAFWAALGVGMLVNTVGGMIGGGGPSRADAMRQHDASMKSLRNTLNQTTGMVTQRRESPVQSRFSFDFEPPPFPQQSFDNLQQMQQQHGQQRQAFTDQLKQQVAQAKEQFFAENHYETADGPDGKPKVQVGEDGQPQVRQGAENPTQKVAREEYEGGKRQQLADQQTTQKDAFLNKERQDVQRFLADNQNNLANPQVQAELTRMVVGTQKRAFGLQQQHEDERWKVDLPPHEETVAMVDDNLAQLRQMEKDHAKAEEQSQDMQSIMDHEQKVAALLGEQKMVAQQQKAEEAFLKDPRQAFAALQAPPDFAEVLPSYLTNALYNMGIYSA